MDKVMQMLSLSKKAGKLISGEALARDAIRYGDACIVILAEDTGKNTAKAIGDSCTYYEVPYYIYGTKDSLGHAIGKAYCAVCAVCDEGLANSIENSIKANINGGE